MVRIYRVCGVERSVQGSVVRSRCGPSTFRWSGIKHSAAFSSLSTKSAPAPKRPGPAVTSFARYSDGPYGTKGTGTSTSAACPDR